MSEKSGKEEKAETTAAMAELREQLERNQAQIVRMEAEAEALRWRIHEREKELAAHALLSALLDELTLPRADAAAVLAEVVRILPPAMQWPDVTAARVTIFRPRAVHATPNWSDAIEPRSRMAADVCARFPERRVLGTLEVAYTEPRGERPFLVEEERLLAVVAERCGQYLTQLLIMERMARLAGSLPRCGCCGRVRDAERAEWESLEQYVARHSSLVLADTVCQQCANSMCIAAQQQQQHP